VTDSISDILRTLIESVLGMRVSFGLQSAEVIHEKSGIVPVVTLLNYPFTMLLTHFILLIGFNSVWIHMRCL
jgi:hypothetical protein